MKNHLGVEFIMTRLSCEIKTLKTYRLMVWDFPKQKMKRKCFNGLPNKVSLSILLHWIAKERSELSKMVMRSSSIKKRREQMIHCIANYLYLTKYVKIPKQKTTFTPLLELHGQVNQCNVHMISTNCT